MERSASTRRAGLAFTAGAMVAFAFVLDASAWSGLLPWLLCPLATILSVASGVRYAAPAVASASAILLASSGIAHPGKTSTLFFVARVLAVGLGIAAGAVLARLFHVARRDEGPKSGFARRMTDLVGRLIRPSAVFLDGLPYPAKLAVILLLVLVPLGSVTKLQYDIATERVEFNAKELWGVEYVEHARAMLHAVQRHRVLDAVAMTGDTSVQVERARAAAEADEAATRLDEVDRRLGGDQVDGGQAGLRTTARFTQARLAWEALKRRHFVTPEESNEAHAAVSAILVDLILAYAANYSNLILDPDLDSYWLMEAFVEKLPQISEAITQGATLALASSADPVHSADRFVEYAGIYKVATSTLASLESVNMATAFREAPHYSKSTTIGQLREPLAMTKTAVEIAAERLRRLHLQGRDASVEDARETAARALEAIRITHAFWGAVGPELQKQCTQRVAVYSRQRSIGLFTSIFGTVVLAYVLLGLYVSIRNAVVALGAAAKRMVDGENEAAVVLSSNDEVADIAGSFNRINDALVEARALRRERDEIAKELHDEILQRLYAIGMTLDVVREDVPNASSRPLLDESVERLNEVIRGVRGVIMGTDSTLIGDDLEQRLRTLARQTARDGGVHVEIELDGDLAQKVDPDLARRVTTLVGEAMQACCVGCRASRARLSLRGQADSIVVEWQDDAAPGHHGDAKDKGLVATLRARAAELGATFEPPTKDGAKPRSDEAHPMQQHLVFRFAREVTHA